MTLSSEIKRLRYVNYFNIFGIPGLEIVRIDNFGADHVFLLFSAVKKIVKKGPWPNGPLNTPPGAIEMDRHASAHIHTRQVSSIRHAEC